MFQLGVALEELAGAIEVEVFGGELGPLHASWVNQIEVWFSILQRRVLRYGSFQNVHALAHRAGLHPALELLRTKPFR